MSTARYIHLYSRDGTTQRRRRRRRKKSSMKVGECLSSPTLPFIVHAASPSQHIYISIYIAAAAVQLTTDVREAGSTRPSILIGLQTFLYTEALRPRARARQALSIYSIHTAGIHYTYATVALSYARDSLFSSAYAAAAAAAFYYLCCANIARRRDYRDFTLYFHLRNDRLCCIQFSYILIFVGSCEFFFFLNSEL